jgi:hypothetical protein
MTGRLEGLKLKAKVDAVLAKGATPETGKWNNHELKVMIQWFKRDGGEAMSKNKEGLLLRYRETHTHVVHYDRGAYPCEDVAAAVADDSRVVTSQQNTNTFAEAAAIYQADAYVPHPTHVGPSVASATTTSIVAGASVVDSAPTVPTSDCQQNDAPSNAPPLDGGEVP